MEPIKLVQTWDPVAGKKQEYASFITDEFRPAMQALGLEIVAGWYVLVGQGPHILVESMADSLEQVEQALHDQRLQEMLGRFRNMVTRYSSSVLVPTGRVAKDHRQVPVPHGIKFIQSWDVLPSQNDEYDRFVQEVHLAEMEALGLEIIAGWQVMIGSGPQILSEALAPDLPALGKALGDERYLRMITQMEDLVTNYECRIFVRHRFFLDTLYKIHGRAIRGVDAKEILPMVGPVAG